MLSVFTARNNSALLTLVEEHNVEVRELPQDVLERLKTLSDEVVAESMQGDELSKRIYTSYMAYFNAVKSYHDISEQSYLNAR